MTLSAGRRRRTSGAIFTASMADVVFLLIVFFVLTYTSTPDLTTVRLPTTLVRTDVPRDAAMISISSPADHQVIRVTTGREMSLPISSDEEIASFVASMVAADPGQPFVVKADHNAQYERIDAVLDALKRSHAKVIYLLSEQKTSADGPAPD